MRPQHSNPCRGIDKFREVARNRFPSETELAAMGKAVSEMEAVGEIRAGVAVAVRLLATTGLRMGEALALRWEEVELSNYRLIIRDAKAGAREQVIGATVVAMLAALKRSGEFVVPGDLPDLPLSPNVLEQVWRRIRERATLAMWSDEADTAACQLLTELHAELGRAPTFAEMKARASKAKVVLSAGIPDLRLHDLRHGFGTFAGQVGANAFLVRDALGHKTSAMTGRYVSKDADPLRRLADAVSSRVHAAMASRRQGEGTADVVPLSSQIRRDS